MVQQSCVCRGVKASEEAWNDLTTRQYQQNGGRASSRDSKNPTRTARQIGITNTPRRIGVTEHPEKNSTTHLVPQEVAQRAGHQGRKRLRYRGPYPPQGTAVQFS